MLLQLVAFCGQTLDLFELLLLQIAQTLARFVLRGELLDDLVDVSHTSGLIQLPKRLIIVRQLLLLNISVDIVIVVVHMRQIRLQRLLVISRPVPALVVSVLVPLFDSGDDLLPGVDCLPLFLELGLAQLAHRGLFVLVLLQFGLGQLLGVGGVVGQQQQLLEVVFLAL